MAAPSLVTLGCRLNTFESEIMRGHAAAAGLEDAIIVNTCAVTAEAERQARQAIRRARRDNPKAHLIVTGCAAQLDPEGFGAMPEVDRVLGNAEKLDPASYRFDGEAERVEVGDIDMVRDTAPHLVGGFDGRTRAFVQIQQGCDHRCTFCIIPFARGANRSLGLGRIVEQTEKLVAAGYREVVLTGVDICSYGTDLPGEGGLGDMVGRLLDAVPELRRLRLSSLDPAALDEALYEVLATEPRLMPHLHLSVQALDDMVLKRMKRRHTVADVVDVVARARRARADTVFGADLIAGFPTETDAMFENTLRALDDLELTHLHVFPYSKRPGTPAARMPQVEPAVRKRRAAALRAAGDRALARFLETQVGATVAVLAETERRGLSEHYAPVDLDFEAEPGAIVRASVTGAEAGRLTGSPAR